MILGTLQSWIHPLDIQYLPLLKPNTTLYPVWLLISMCRSQYINCSRQNMVSQKAQTLYVCLQERGLSAAMQPPSVPAGVWKYLWVKWGPMWQKVMKPVDVRLIFYNSTNICDDWPDAAGKKSVWEKERKKIKPDQSESAVWMVFRTGFTLLLGLKKQNKMGSLRRKNKYLQHQIKWQQNYCDATCVINDRRCKPSFYMDFNQQ